MKTKEQIQAAAKAANVKWNAENKRLGIGKHAPYSAEEKKAAHDLLMADHFRNLPHYVLD